jgi:hypothetical protein
VEPADPLPHLRDEAQAVRTLADVGADVVDGRPDAPQLFEGGGNLGLVPLAAEREVERAPGQGPGDPEPDATRAPRDEGDAPHLASTGAKKA